MRALTDETAAVWCMMLLARVPWLCVGRGGSGTLNGTDLLHLGYTVLAASNN